ncbi:ALP1-like protein [Tanacetum coccineum]
MFKSTERLKGPGTEPNSTFAIRELAYDDVPDALDEYLQMDATTSRDALPAFGKAIVELYGDEFLRKPIYIDIKKLYAFHEQKDGFLVMIGSINCTDWSLENCPNAYRALFNGGNHRSIAFILLEVIASQDLWMVSLGQTTS